MSRISHIGVDHLGMKWGETIRNMGVKKETGLRAISEGDLAALLAGTSCAKPLAVG